MKRSLFLILSIVLLGGLAMAGCSDRERNHIKEAVEFYAEQVRNDNLDPPPAFQAHINQALLDRLQTTTPASLDSPAPAYAILALLKSNDKGVAGALMVGWIGGSSPLTAISLTPRGGETVRVPVPSELSGGGNPKSNRIVFGAGPMLLADDPLWETVRAMASSNKAVDAVLIYADGSESMSVPVMIDDQRHGSAETKPLSR